MESNTTKGSKKNMDLIETVEESPEKLFERIKNAGFGDSTLTLTIYNVTDKKEIGARGENEEEEKLINFGPSQAVPTARYEINMGSPTVKLVDKIISKGNDKRRAKSEDEKRGKNEDRSTDE